MPTPTDYQRFCQFARRFSQAHPRVAVAGDYYDAPGTTVYHRATRQLREGGWIEVNAITPETPAAFAWEVEITINDKADGRFIHLIVQRDRRIVETYGKTLLPVSRDRTADILEVLAELATS